MTNSVTIMNCPDFFGVELDYHNDFFEKRFLNYFGFESIWPEL